MLSIQYRFLYHIFLTRMDPVPVEDVYGFLGSNAVLRGSDAVCVNATFRCTDPLPPCRSLLGFDFPSLWEITKNYHGKCHQGAWLVASATSATIALTNDAAEAIAGAIYKIYATSDIWYVNISKSFAAAFSVSGTKSPDTVSYWVEHLTPARLCCATPTSVERQTLWKLKNLLQLLSIDTLNHH